MAGGGPARTGAFAGRVRLGGRPIRRLRAEGAVQSAPVFDAAGNVYVADMSGTVQAFDTSGKPVWRRKLEGSISATPAVDNESHRVFVGTHKGWLYCLACMDGSVAWNTQIPSRTDPRIVSDLLCNPVSKLVVASSWGGQFTAFDFMSGQSKTTWSAGISHQAGASADTTGNVYFQRAVTGEGVVCGRVAPDGVETVLHREPECKRGAGRTVVAAAPVLDESRGRAYFVVNVDAGCDVVAYGLHEQQVVWRKHIAKMVVATPALRPDGAVIVGAMDGTLHAFGADGSSVFAFKTLAEYLLAAPVCDADSNTYLPDPMGCVHTVNRVGEGRQIFEAERSFQARPAFDPAGNLHVPGTDGLVHVMANITAV